MKKKYIIEICEDYACQIDDKMADCCYVTFEDLEENILKMIDSDDIYHWIPIGSKKFIDKFNKLYIN